MPVNLQDYYRPHSGQQIIHNSNAKYKWNQAGRRWGKSRMGVGELMESYVEWLQLVSTRKRDKDLVPGFHAWVVVPTFAQGRQTWHELMELIPKDFISRHREEEYVIYLKGPNRDTWGFVELKSAHDPQTLQTVGLDFLWIQEAQDVHDDAIIKLMPTTHSPNRFGRALFEGIPSMWSDHWFQRGYEAAKRKATKSHEAFHFTCYDNPLLTQENMEEIEFDRELMTIASWERMYLARFNMNAGFFKGIDSCIEGDIIEHAIPGGEYVGGLDFGVSQDATVLTVMDANSRKVMNRYRWDSTTWPVMREHIIAIHDDWNFYRIACDTSNMGGIAMYQELSQANLPVEEFKFQGENRQNLLGNLQVAIERASIRYPFIESMLRELRMFQYVRLNSGKYRVQAPNGEHDDEVMALALAVEMCNSAVSVHVGGKLYASRYMPTYEEFMQGGMRAGIGVTMMKDRIEERRRQRWQKSGLLN